MRTFAVGDIHGCLDHLEALLARIGYRPGEDRLIFLGDYVDRGPDAAGVVERLLELRAESPHVVCLMGNHERMFLDFLEGRRAEPFLFNGGRETLASYRRRSQRWQRLTGRAEVPDAHVEFLRGLPLLHTTPTHIFVHAGLKPGVPLAEQREEDLLWIRDEFLAAPVAEARTVVFGHSPMVVPLRAERKVGIDTGACYGGPLTAYEVEADRFHAARP
ncbi:MAG: serine/threonine protein phosphatase [Nitrospirae bacterium]|nr:MAG: serine/threonine protein phosphatase [Nitrospirota bacterium]